MIICPYASELEDQVLQTGVKGVNADRELAAELLRWKESASNAEYYRRRRANRTAAP